MSGNAELMHLLWSLQNDAAHARALLMEGDDRGLAEVGKAMKMLEAAVIRRDVERQSTR